MSIPYPDGDHNEQWLELARYAYAVIDDAVRKSGINYVPRIGGGSMLLRRYRHRKSKDLDLFVTDARFLRFLSPRNNDAADDLFPDYGEQVNVVRLIYDIREVDFILAPPVCLDDDVEKAEIRGRDVLVERPREILAKKIAYRGHEFQPRDVFDFAAIIAAEEEEVAQAYQALSSTHIMDLKQRLDGVNEEFLQDITNKVEPYPEFEHLLKDAFPMVYSLVEAWCAEIPNNPNP